MGLSKQQFINEREYYMNNDKQKGRTPDFGGKTNQRLRHEWADGVTFDDEKTVHYHPYVSLLFDWSHVKQPRDESEEQ
jgi:hypothetical protein